jgi:surface carbohydrate biosynthesis protein
MVRLTLGNLTKAQVVIFDRIFEEEFRTLIEGRHSVALFDPRFKNINLHALFFGAVRWAFSGFKQSITFWYFHCFLELTGAEAVLSGADNNEILYRVRDQEIFSDVKFIIWQNGARNIADLSAIASGKPPLNPIDTVFCLSRAYKSIYESTVARHASVVAAGSILASVHMSDFNQERFDAAFISPWSYYSAKGAGFWSKRRLDEASESEFFEQELKVLPALLSTLEQLGLRLTVLGSSVEFHKEEFEFYSRALGTNRFTFSKRCGVLDSYSKIGGFQLLFATDSTLGYEALGLGFPVMFLRASVPHAGRVRPPYPNSENNDWRRILLDESAIEKWTESIANSLEMPSREWAKLVSRIWEGHPVALGRSELVDRLGIAITGGPN